jgi:hypothetical protein
VDTGVDRSWTRHSIVFGYFIVKYVFLIDAIRFAVGGDPRSFTFIRQ